MATLTENLTEIKRQKDTYILPENIKKDVTVFGVTGTLESGGTASSGIKQFSTIEEMQADTTAKEGDLAVVYRSEIHNATVDSKFQVATFPDTVVLDTAITGNVEVRYRAVDSSKMFDCMGSLDSSRFMMDCYSETGEVRIEYTSSDGITYTRTDNTGNPVDFGTEIYYAYTDMWNNAIGKFIQVCENVFEGLYESKTHSHTDKFLIPYLSSIYIENSNVNYDKNASNDFDYNTKLFNICKSILDTYYADGYKASVSTYYPTIMRIGGYWYLPIFTHTQDKSGYTQGKFVNSDCFYGYIASSANIPDSITKFVIRGNSTESSSTEGELQLYKLDTDNETYELVDNSIFNIEKQIVYSSYSSSTNYYYIFPIDNVETLQVTVLENEARVRYGANYVFIDSLTGTRYIPNSNSIGEPIYYYSQDYLLAPTQLTAITEYVYGKEFYGKNGVETGTLQNKENLTKDEVKHRVDIWSNYNSGIVCPSDASNMFYNCTSLTEIPLLNTSNVTSMQSMFYYCTNLTTIPELDTSNVTNMYSMFYGCTNLDEIPLLNTSNVTNMYNMFRGCTNLTTIPELDTSSVTNMENMFYGCTSLTTIPLLNTSKLKDVHYMFYNCNNLTEIPLLDISNVVDMSDMFASCTSLIAIPEFNTSNVVNMTRAFQNCSSLTSVPLLDTSKVTNMGATFASCKKLTTIPLLNTSNVTNMNSMFNGCTNLTTIPELNTINVTNMGNMFYQCTNLTTIPLLNTSKVTGMYNMFLGCSSLENVPQLDTSNVTDISQMFYECSNIVSIPHLNTVKSKSMNYVFYNCVSLTTVPQLNTSSATDMNGLFKGCTALSDESLNNILAMCTNAVKITSNKTLKYIGLTSEQATRCQSLSNYSAFTSAGWTTGY